MKKKEQLRIAYGHRFDILRKMDTIAKQTATTNKEKAAKAQAWMSQKRMLEANSYAILQLQSNEKMEQPKITPEKVALWVTISDAVLSIVEKFKSIFKRKASVKKASKK